ncbi:MAG: glycoside hydrolase family 1 protein [Myxococcota bacterium]
MPARLSFPDGFLWGVSVSSHQVEGGNVNSWSRWEEQGHVHPGEHAGRACDWWANAERDLDLAKELGLGALRFSIEWSRVEPRPGEWDEGALRRYRQICEGIRERGMEPWICLHHFSNPLWFEDAGAFLARDADARFAAYAARVVDALGDVCDRWLTFNEPNVYVAQGYLRGEFPPGRSGDVLGMMRATAAMARGHARAYRHIHGRVPGAQVGWAHHEIVFDPARPGHPLDRRVARLQDLFFNDPFPDVVRTGRLRGGPRAVVGDVAEARDTFDLYGLNLYGRLLVRFDPRRPVELFGAHEDPGEAPRGASELDGSPVGDAYPAGLGRVIDKRSALGRPIYVTEHGVADAADRIRPWLLTHAVRHVHDAIARGRDVRGFFHWTLTDNFEWTWGWKKRFGLVALDVATQERTPRPSARYYAAIARANALTAEMVREHAPGELEAG